MFDRLFTFNMKRLDAFISSLPKLFFKSKHPLACEVAVSADAVPFEKRLTLAYKSIYPGEKWGKDWESGWFHVTGEVPESWDKGKIKLLFHPGGEGLIFDKNGNPAARVTGGSVYSADFCQNEWLLPASFIRDGKIDIFIEGAANTLFGLVFDRTHELRKEHPQGRFTGILETCCLGLWDEEIWHFYIDLKVIRELISGLPENDHRRKRYARLCIKSADIFQSSGVAAARAVLQEIFAITPSGSLMTAHAVGHAHIDTGWLWPVRETVRKCARTYAAQLDLIERYPEYIFGASAPQHYAFIKEHYPDLYRRIKEAVRKGNWELQGGMWVEADGNVISGESMVRQFLHGKNFFMDEFGVDVKNLWLPDVFGYSGSMPQIIKRSGCDYFLTQKLSWSQFNTFPYKSFNWKGIDGSSVLTHFPPENSYNSTLKPDKLIKAQEEYPEGDILSDYMSLFGIGDGGGGAYPELIERGRRLAHLDGVPQVKFAKAASFFEKLSAYKDELPTWQGELYLELHRGTLTTQSRTKRLNRKNEQLLTETEFICSMLPLENYPQTALDRLWKLLLLNQFHDIIPGSSIHMVYEQTESELRGISTAAENLITGAVKKLFPAVPQSAVILNTLSNEYETLIELPLSWESFRIEDEKGVPVTVQPIGSKLLAKVNVPGSSCTHIKCAGPAAADHKCADFPGELVLENEFVRYEFNSNAMLISAFDKRNNRPILKSGEYGNKLALYDDTPINYDAWDIDHSYLDQVPATPESVSAEWVEYGPLRQTIRFELSLSNSRIVQHVSLESTGARLDFKSDADWHEEHKMLRTAFFVNVFASEAAFDIQYGFIKRPTHKNSSWDFARFECCGQRYADISSDDYGVALLNDCKYGYHVYDNCLDLNLLRSPVYPDHLADQGKHSFTYSFLPHRGNLVNSGVMTEAALLNRPPRVIIDAGKGSEPCCRIASTGITLEVVKKAEKESCLILRLVEIRGEKSCGTLYFNSPVHVSETSLMEWEEEKLCENVSQLPLQLDPFEIRTLKVRLLPQ